jgi:hypothetical protein
MRLSNAALYQAKAEGRNRCVLASATGGGEVFPNDGTLSAGANGLEGVS